MLRSKTLLLAIFALCVIHATKSSKSTSSRGKKSSSPVVVSADEKDAVPKLPEKYAISDSFGVVITGKSPNFMFSLSGYNPKIQSVDFVYKFGTADFQRTAGIRTTEGWKLKTTGPKGTTTITAYAVGYSSERKALVKTPEVKTPAKKNVFLPRPVSYVFFADDFNSLSLSDWKIEVSAFQGYNYEFQVYTNDLKNVFTKNGYLHLQPTRTVDHEDFSVKSLGTGAMDLIRTFGECTNTHHNGCLRQGVHSILPTVMSGKITSLFTMKFGVLEVRARLPKGDWLWPAIWLMPEHRKYGEWPKSGEIDICESRGNKGPLGFEHVTSTLHWGNDVASNKYTLTQKEVNGTDWTKTFHTYKLVWTPNEIKTYVDDKLILNVLRSDGGFWKKSGYKASEQENAWETGTDMAPFDEEFHLNLNVAVGTSLGYFPDGDFYEGTKKPWKNNDPKSPVDFWKARDKWYPTWKVETGQSAMVVDWVKFSTY